MLYILLMIAVILVLAVVLSIPYLKNKSSNQILLLAIELTIVGGIMILSWDKLGSWANETVFKICGLILIGIGLIISILGFYMKNDKK